MRPLRSLVFSGKRVQVCNFGSGPSPRADHYAILGVKPGCDAKEIKAAYYDLSKQYHPDTNPNDKDESSKKFHEVAQAYEVLGNEEQRKIYDMTRIRSAPDVGSGYARPVRQQTSRQYTDIDIDYRSFEQFQKSARRRKHFHSHFDMPPEFYSEFGGKNRTYKSEFEEATEHAYSIHRDSRAAAREKAELERELEREKARQQEKYPIPTFEQMIIERRKKESEEHKKYAAGMLGVCSLGMLLFFIMR